MMTLFLFLLHLFLLSVVNWLAYENGKISADAKLAKGVKLSIVDKVFTSQEQLDGYFDCINDIHLVMKQNETKLEKFFRKHITKKERNMERINPKT